MCALTQPTGGPHGMGVAVAATGGTYSNMPGVMLMDVRQLPLLRISGVEL